MNIKYFSWIRETVGKSEENLAKPETIASVKDLLDHLSSLSEHHATALRERVFVKVAVNQVHADHDAPIAEEDEIAIFPPVTGG